MTSHDTGSTEHPRYPPRDGTARAHVRPREGPTLLSSSGVVA